MSLQRKQGAEKGIEMVMTARSSKRISILNYQVHVRALAKQSKLFGRKTVMGKHRQSLHSCHYCIMEVYISNDNEL
jgi:hypothetical protein